MNDTEYKKKIELLLRDILTAFLLQPDELLIKPVSLGRCCEFEIQASRSDTPRLLGKGGQHWRALRRILAGMAYDRGIAFTIKMIEPEVGEVERHDWKANRDWTAGRASVIDILVRTLEQLFRKTVWNEQTNETKTVLDVEVKPPVPDFDGLGEAMRVIWNAIGRAHGRALLVNLWMGKNETEQPETSDGRFAPVKTL